MTKIGKKFIHFHYKIFHEFPSGGQAGPNGLVHRKVEDLIYNKVNGHFCDFHFSWTNFMTRFWARGYMPRGCSAHQKKGLETLIC